LLADMAVAAAARVALRALVRKSAAPRSNILAKHPDREKARLYANALFRARYARQSLKERLRVQAYKHANPRLPIIMSAVRADRAKRQSDGTLTTKSVRALIAAATHCAYCNVSFMEARATLDHMEPLVRGGAHSLANAAVACLSCNLTKGRMNWAEWQQGLTTRGNSSSAKGLRVLPPHSL
jgi:hypothetical protein